MRLILRGLLSRVLGIAILCGVLNKEKALSALSLNTGFISHHFILLLLFIQLPLASANGLMIR
jgi:hypothetical protein